MRDTLEADRCDLWPGVARGVERLATTRPYYRSSYVFVTRADRKLDIATFDDPRLRQLRIGVQMIGNDATSTPPAHALARRGIVANVHGYMVYGDYAHPNPASVIIDAVANGEIDVAVAWGPLAGYFAASERRPLTVTPVEPGSGDANLPMAFAISMGLRHGDTALQHTIEQSLQRRQPEIDAILAAYHVPLLRLPTEAASAAQR